MLAPDKYKLLVMSPVGSWFATVMVQSLITRATARSMASSSPGVSNLLPEIEGFILIFHVVELFAILNFSDLSCAPDSHTTAKDIFTQSPNNGCWDVQGIPFWVGISSNVFMFLGMDILLC
ncbi:hypothetical protein BJ878DRAFT_476399 [Calycina marina]|uniref:Uncharacterized protein n=1 Tax=Calycina marina TaxID=1763456 RepID=A0A9P7ZB08_9HELO|nr:hypothetical protein BJ878DRAFT_476399 [Calycina marina]